MLRIDDRHDVAPRAPARGPAAPVPPPPFDHDAGGHGRGDGDARRTLRAQITRLERELADALLAVFPTAPDIDVRVPVTGATAGPRLLTLGDLETIRDALADRLGRARTEIDARGAEHERNRALLEEMRRHPERHKLRRLSNRAIGETGCGVWEVRPRLGIIGMMMGWWHVKLSSGCPLRPSDAPRSIPLDGQAQPQAVRRWDRDPAPARPRPVGVRAPP